MRLFIVSFFVFFVFCSSLGISESEIVGFTIVTHSISTSQPCDYVFVYCNENFVKTVFVGDTALLRGNVGDRLTAEWRTRCTEKTTETRDTIISSGLVWSIP